MARTLRAPGRQAARCTRPGGVAHRPYRLDLDSRAGCQADYRCAGVRGVIRPPRGVSRSAARGWGSVFHEANHELTKRYFREAPGTRRTHIHVRRAGSFSEQFALLFRDYLREHDADARAYAVLKYRLAEQYGIDREGYTEAKGPFIWEIIRKADQWAQQTGWAPGASGV